MLNHSERSSATTPVAIDCSADEDFTDVPPSGALLGMVSIPKTPKVAASSLQDAVNSFYRSTPGIWLTCDMQGKYASKLFRSA